MDKNRVLGVALILFGLAILAGSLLADIIGIGDADPDHFTFGFKQIIGSVAGLAIASAGLFIAMRR